MRDQLPERLDVMGLARQGGALAGELPVKGMARLGDALCAEPDPAVLELRFGLDDHSIPYAHGRVQARLPLVCQRCLQPMVWLVDNVIHVGFTPSEAASAQLPGSYDPVVYDEDGGISLTGFIEDELILALPIVARHPDRGQCPSLLATYEPAAEPPVGESPFAALQHLKKRDS